jgi:hypothetical protein
LWIRTHNKIGNTLFENAAKLKRRNQNYSYEGVELYLKRLEQALRAAGG